MIRLTVLDQLKTASSLEDFADVLNYQSKGLSFILYKGPSTGRYFSFNVPKKSGGVRVINAPDELLKSLQKRLAEKLGECKSEISKKRNLPDSISHGFEKDKSIVTNAWQNKNRRFVLNIDLEDFFPSINFGRVRGFFIKNHDFLLHEKAATLIAQIACFENALPQGSPCSPIISNLVAHLLDVRLSKLAKQQKCTYSRYVDDITFSTNQKIFPTIVAQEVSDAPGIWKLGEALTNEITRTGFKVNQTKTRMQCRPSQQVVTGLTVNVKVNIQASYYRSARAMCNSLFKTGSYFNQPNSTKNSNLLSKPTVRKDVSHIEGIVSHIYYVKHTSALKSGYIDLGKDASEIKKHKYPAYRELYKKLLYFKHFVNLDMPLLVCEGKTDNIYLRSALKALAKSYPTLAKLENNSLKAEIRFLKHSRNEHDILELSGGSSNLASLIGRYDKAIYRYYYRPLKFPVIILIDNDSGSSPVFKSMKGLSINMPSLTTREKFYHLCHNLYLIKTPERGETGESCIEDLFDNDTRDVKINGKTLSLAKEFDDKIHYGKLDFADRVVRSNVGKIDFSAFAPLFDRIVAVINNYDMREKS